MSKPTTRLVAYTQWADLDEVPRSALENALADLKAESFIESIIQANRAKLPAGAAMCSMFAKMCYRSLVLGQNANVKQVRDIEDNLKSVIESGHGSVLEHFWFSFVTTNCSRVFTHELVRHRVGTAFSQTSGRYVSIDELELVLPPELELGAPGVIECVECPDCSGVTRDIPCECCSDIKVVSPRQAVEWLQEVTIRTLRSLRSGLIGHDADMATKKRLTSAIRRLAPNGQANEIAWSANWRALRHMIEMRTSRHAEWEIRQVFGDVADMLFERWPILLYGGARGELHDGVYEWIGLKL